MNTIKTIFAAIVMMFSFAGITQAALPTCENVSCPTVCGYAGGAVTNGAYDFINHSPWIVCKTKACAATAPCPVDCVEHLSDCSATCGGGIQTPVIDTPAANGGAACVLTEQACNIEACPIIPPAVDCPTACGNAESTVADGQGGLKTCEATEACAAPVETPKQVITTGTVTPCTANCGGISGGDYIWKSNPQMWIMTQIHFIEAKIERLQAELSKLLGK
jgi:hypothetical protein